MAFVHDFIFYYTRYLFLLSIFCLNSKKINQFQIYLFLFNLFILKFRNPTKHRYILWWAFIQVQRSLLLQFIEYVKFADNHFSVVSAKALNNIDTLIGFFYRTHNIKRSIILTHIFQDNYYQFLIFVNFKQFKNSLFAKKSTKIYQDISVNV